MAKSDKKNQRKAIPVRNKGIVPITEKLNTNQASPVNISYRWNDVVEEPELKKFLIEQDEKTTLRLEDDMIKNGIEQPLDIWLRGNEKVVVDGYTRRKIAQKHNLTFKIKIRNFASIEEAKMWMIENQTRRRNLSSMQKAYYIGYQYEKLKKDDNANLKNIILSASRLPGGQNDHPTQNTDNQHNTMIHVEHSGIGGQNDHPKERSEKTAEFIGRVHKIGEKTVRRHHQVYKGIEAIQKINPKLGLQVLREEVELNQGVIEKFGDLDVMPKSLETVVDIIQACSETKPASKKNSNEKSKVVSSAKMLDARLIRFKKKPTAKLQEECINMLEVQIDHLQAELKKVKGTKVK